MDYQRERNAKKGDFVYLSLFFSSSTSFFNSWMQYSTYEAK